MQLLPESMDVVNIRAEGNAVKLGLLAEEKAAFKSGVDSRYCRRMAVLLGEHLGQQITQRGILPVCPARIVSADAHAAAELFSQAGETVDEHGFLTGDA